MRNFYCCILLSCLCVCSCSTDSPEKRYRQILQEFQGKQIQFPDELGGNPLSENYDFIILAYIDSASCTTCRMRLSQWNEFLVRIEDETENDVGFVMVLNSSEDDELLSNIKFHRFTRPILFDSLDAYNQLNHFPSESSCQTFLLNSDNRILAIGSPVESNSIEALYMSIIGGAHVFDQNGRRNLVVDNPTQYVENVIVGDSVRVEFNIRNVTSDTLRIDRVDASCECVTLRPSATEIPPHEDLTVSMKYVADMSGEINRQGYIYFEDLSSPVILNLVSTK